MRKIYSMLHPEDYLDSALDYINEYDEPEMLDKIDELADQLMYDDWENFYRPVLENYFDRHNCIIDGCSGRWDGRYYGGDVTENARGFFDHLEDCYYVEIYEDDKALVIEGVHHDGRVSMEVRELTDHGFDWYRNYSDDWAGGDALRYLFDYNFNSRKPNIDWCL